MRSFKFLIFQLLLLQRLKLATSNLVCWLHLPRPIIKHTQRKTSTWLSAREARKLWGFPFVITATAEANHLNLVGCLGLPRSVIKTHLHRKVGMALGLGKLPKNLGSPLLFIYATSGCVTIGVHCQCTY